MRDAYISVQGQPVNPADRDRLNAVRQLPHSDWAERIDMASAAPLVTIWGRDCDHLHALVWELEEKHGIAMTFQAPAVAYRKTIARSTVMKYTHREPADGAEQSVDLVLKIEPTNSDAPLRFTSKADAIPQTYLDSVKQGCSDAIRKGLWDVEYPLFNIGVTLTALHCSPETPAPSAVVNAARATFGHGARRCGEILLEPLVKLVVNTPVEFMGDIIGDINSRRGSVRRMEPLAEQYQIVAIAPVGTLFGYRSTLNHLTRGKASYVSECSHYDQAPRSTPPEDGRFPPAAAMRA